MLTLPPASPVGRPVSRHRVGWCLLVLLAGWLPAQAQTDASLGLGQPGYVVLEAARDSSAAFIWEPAPDPGFRVLVWPEGRLTVPDSLPVEDFGRRDLGFACTALLTGTGESGEMVIRDGIFTVSEPVVLSDGVMLMEVSAGELEFRGAMVRYRRTVTSSGEFKSGFLLLAGMTLLIVVLLRRARIKSGEGVR